MENDPLQQLRDVHLPLDPGWWPPAVGWWLILLILLAAIAWAATLAARRHLRRRPVRQAQALLANLYTAVQAGEITPVEYLHTSNEILKRTLVPGLGHTEYARLAGDAWLAALDEISGTEHFSNGPGRVLGNDRFSKDPQVDADKLHAEVALVLAKVTP